MRSIRRANLYTQSDAYECTFPVYISAHAAVLPQEVPRQESSQLARSTTASATARRPLPHSSLVS